MAYNSPDDKCWLAAMGVALESPNDVHALCHQRWIEERQKREIAEESIVANAAAYSALAEIREAEIRHQHAAAVTGWCIAVIACLALVVTWAVK
jgi:hypothetical protein